MSLAAVTAIAAGGKDAIHTAGRMASGFVEPYCRRNVATVEGIS